MSGALALDALLPAFDGEVIAKDTDKLERADWLALRRQGIGGSDAAAICGFSSYSDPFTVWLEKTGLVPIDEGPGSEAAEWGHELEPIVRKKASDRRGIPLYPVNMMLKSAALPWLIGDVDGAAPTIDGVYEGKTVSPWADDGWQDDNVPAGHVVQGASYLALTNAQRVLYACLVGGQRLEVRIMERDEGLIDHLLTILSAFWQSVEQGVPPMPSGNETTTDLLAHLWEVVPEAVRTLSRAELDPILEERAQLKAMTKQAAARLSEIDNGLKAALGDHEIAADEDGQTLYTWKKHHRRGVDEGALLAAVGYSADELAANYGTVTPYRSIYVPKAKKR